jgi:hypothetical protein
MSAHSVGCAATQSQRRVERGRQAAIEQQRQVKQERDAYLERLATKLAQECQLPEKIALERVKAFSVLSHQERERERDHLSLTFARFG